MSWFDVMPRIPLKWSVPVRYNKWTVGVYLKEEGGEAWVVDSEFEPVAHPDEQMRVDLEDPQGFAYVLRLLLPLISKSEADKLVEWWCQKPTIEQCEQLANLCREFADELAGG